MTIRGQVKQILRSLLAKFGFDIVPSAYVYDWQVDLEAVSRVPISLPPDARQYLRPDNPLLLDLQERYQNFCEYPSDEILLWTADRISPEDMLNFRGHNAYVFQEGSFNRNPFGYLLAYYYLKARDELGLLDVLSEDSAFGAVSYRMDGRQVSRDLLDSILEIYFLQDNLPIMDKEDLTVVDIGAGYGRLAHRMTRAVKGLKRYYCVDAVGVSTFICDYYLKYRRVADRAQVVPLDCIRDQILPGEIDLAVNIHSFSECTLPAIQWWLDLLKELEVPNLMIIPNSKEGRMINIHKQDFSSLIEKSGYQLITSQPKYLDPIVQKYALNPDYSYLYSLQ